jgi:hypothetical protein
MTSPARARARTRESPAFSSRMATCTVSGRLAAVNGMSPIVVNMPTKGGPICA